MTRIATLIIFAFLICTTLTAGSTMEEKRHARRILDFWKDKELSLVKSQIESFQSLYPESDFNDNFNTIIGDISWSERSYTKALDSYNKISEKGTNDSIRTKIRLAKILVDKGESKEAISTFIELADTYPLQREDFLFEAGKLQLKYDQKNAVITFASIQQMNGKNKGASALLKAALLYEMKEYNQILNEKESLRNAAEENNSTAMELLIGRSLFALHRNEEAIRTLTPLLTAKLISKKDQQELLLTLTAAHYRLQHYEEVENLASIFEKSFKNDSLLANILFIKALNEKDQGHNSVAQGYLQKILWDYPGFILNDNVRFEYYNILFAEGQWERSRQGFTELIRTYPDSTFAAKSLPLISAATEHLLKEAGNDPEKVKALKEQLIIDLQVGLAHETLLSPSQQVHYKLKLAGSLINLERYEEGISLINTFIYNEKIDHKLRAQAHIIFATALLNQNHELAPYILHLESALAIDQSLPQALPVHLNLFNAYVELPHTKENEHKAADHLGYVYEAKRDSISRENKAWLASHFYHSLKVSHDETAGEPLQNPEEILQAEKGASLLEGLLTNAPQTITQQSITLEEDYYKLASFYGWLGKSQKQLEILENLYAMQKSSPDLPWSLRARTLLSLANAKVQKNQPTDALALYREIIAMKRIDPFVAGTARLQFSRIGFDLLPKEKRTLNDPDTIAILSLLKDLQIQKRLNEEPLHFEASIEYARIRSSLDPVDQQPIQQLALYNRIKDEYTSRDDIASKDYHDSRTVMPEKDRLYQSYITLLDAHIARLEALKAKQSGNLSEMSWKTDAARALYSSLLEKKESLTQYLKIQAEAALDAMSSRSKQENPTP